MIGVFDSGFGGLTVFSALARQLPGHDFLYLGDSARAPYGDRSPESINEFSREAVEFLFAAGCPLVVLACNTASARALRNLQQLFLPARFPDRRILGVVRPSAESLAGLPPGAIPGSTPPGAATGTVAVLGTRGTIASDSYGIELHKLAPGLRLILRACPMWVPLVEAGETHGPGAEHFVRQEIAPLFADPATAPDRILLACTHYPLLLPLIRASVAGRATLLDQAAIVAERLADWLRRHPEMDARLTRAGARRFLTTDDPAWFASHGATILGHPLEAERVRLG